MKLTRKQLNQITLQLPHPYLVIEGRHPNYIEIPVLPSMGKVVLDEGVPSDTTISYKRITFRFDKSEMDWVLDGFEI